MSDDNIEYKVECADCDESFTSSNESAAVGWMFGHSMRTGHNNIEKREV